LRQREEERQQEKERIAAMLAQVESGKRKDGHITFDDEDRKPGEMYDEDNQAPIAAIKAPKDAVKWMFDSDDSDADDTPGNERYANTICVFSFQLLLTNNITYA
jgi:hypothetical protein